MKMKTMLVMLLQQKGMGMKAMLTKRCVLKYKVLKTFRNGVGQKSFVYINIVQEHL